MPTPNRPSLQLMLSCPRRRLLYPSRVALEASLRTDDGRPIGGARVWFEAELRQGFSAVANAVTDRDGRCSVALRVRRGRRYRARFPGDLDRPETVSHSSSIVVIPKIEAKLRTRSVRAGSRTVIAGHIRPRKRFVTLEVERHLRGQHWAALESRDIPLVSGAFEAQVELADAGIYRCRVRFDGDTHNAEAASPWLTVQATA